MKSTIAFLTVFIVSLSTTISFGQDKMEGKLIVKNETISPKIFSIENITPSKSKTRYKFTIKKEKFYNLEAGFYQLNYFNIIKREKHSLKFRLNGNDSVKVVFFKTGETKYDADIKLEQ